MTLNATAFGKGREGIKAGSAEGRRAKCKNTYSRWKWFIICTGKTGKTKTLGPHLVNWQASTKYKSERFVLLFICPHPFRAWMMLKGNEELHASHSFGHNVHVTVVFPLAHLGTLSSANRQGGRSRTMPVYRSVQVETYLRSSIHWAMSLCH